MPPTTRAAEDLLERYCICWLPARYIELLRTADAIRRERKASWLGRIHVALAVARLGREERDE